MGPQQSWSKEETITDCQSKEANILWSHHDETREFPGERHNAKNNATCTQTQKTTHSLDSPNQNVDRTYHAGVIRTAEDRDKSRKYMYIHGVANPRIEDD